MVSWKIGVQGFKTTVLHSDLEVTAVVHSLFETDYIYILNLDFEFKNSFSLNSPSYVYRKVSNSNVICKQKQHLASVLPGNH